MISLLNFIVYTSFIVFAIISGIQQYLKMCLHKRIEQSPSSPPSSTLDDNNDDIIISEEICPPYCSPPPPIQELPQEQSP